MTIRITGLDTTVGAVNKLTEAYRDKLPRLTVDTLVEFALESLARLTPGKGVYKRAWEALTNVTPTGSFYTLIKNAFEDTEKGKTVLYVLEGGSRPHEILPRFANALHFQVSGGLSLAGVGQVVDNGLVDVFSKRVHHPGTRPYRMVEETESRMNDIVDEVREKIIRDLDSSFGG